MPSKSSAGGVVVDLDGRQLIVSFPAHVPAVTTGVPALHLGQPGHSYEDRVHVILVDRRWL